MTEEVHYVLQLLPPLKQHHPSLESSTIQELPDDGFSSNYGAFMVKILPPLCGSHCRLYLLLLRSPL
jgi:hypothetical protein